MGSSTVRVNVDKLLENETESDDFSVEKARYYIEESEGETLTSRDGKHFLSLMNFKVINKATGEVVHSTYETSAE